MTHPQPRLLADVPPVGRYLTFGLAPGADVRTALARVAALRVDDDLVVGLGAPLVEAAGAHVPGLHGFVALSGPGGAFPSTQGAVWVFVAGDDAGAVLHRARGVAEALGPALVLDEDVAAFRYDTGRDLSGYEDGTENPKGDDAVATALVAGAGPGLDGGSFVSVQRWVHALRGFEALPEPERDAIVGRRHATNDEIADAPASAHVKRTAQESFAPPAFLVRRSMPWGGVGEHGLVFVAYAASLDPFERILRRMAGLEDGVPDALMRFSRPVTGGAYWCPPAGPDGRLDLRAVGV